MERPPTGYWKLGGTDRNKNETGPVAIKSSARTLDPAHNYARANGTFEIGGIRVNLVTYDSIPGVIQIKVSKTRSEWNTLRTLNHVNIVGFDDNKPSFNNWLPTSAGDHLDNIKEWCELYISKPPLPVSVAAATAQYTWSVLDAQILNALKFLADHNLCRGEFTTEQVLVTEEGFKLANIHLCEAAGATTDVGDLRSVGRILTEVLIGKRSVPKDVEWFRFYTIVMREKIAFKAYQKVLPRLLSENWPESSGETTSQNDRLRGIAYLVSQRQRNTFELLEVAPPTFTSM
ncbi:hypothetical protein O988_02708 [Pseudogymnoascus sp. VKM F-3808]|nr:hypothetical protein O988_02708 [Pseudogymnoascus sp. VKM F-3808]